MSYKILYIDDTAYWRETYEEAFRAGGIEIKTLPDARGDIVEEISVFTPDLILLDISMPVVNGFEALKILKGNEKTKNFPVFFFSNISSPDYIKKGLELGAEKYLVKGDYQPEEVVKIITKYVQPK
jgi:DNA-binding response OmpR family regulator